MKLRVVQCYCYEFIVFTSILSKIRQKKNNIDIQVKTLPCCSKYWPLGLNVNLTVAQIAKYEKKN